MRAACVACTHTDTRTHSSSSSIQFFGAKAWLMRVAWVACACSAFNWGHTITNLVSVSITAHPHRTCACTRICAVRVHTHYIHTCQHYSSPTSHMCLWLTSLTCSMYEKWTTADSYKRAHHRTAWQLPNYIGLFTVCVCARRLEAMLQPSTLPSMS